ncbi:hypothetical protein CRYUN_Cryun17cG0014800 [Craigia yunnanensis]
MEQKLQETLDTIMSKCRPMTRTEKRQLQKLIQKLPKENLVRVVEIVQRGRSAEKPFGEEIFVDLEKEYNPNIIAIISETMTAVLQAFYEDYYMLLKVAIWTFVVIVDQWRLSRDSLHIANDPSCLILLSLGNLAILH